MCSAPAQVRQIICTLLSSRMELTEIELLYADIESKFTQPIEKLSWPEGIVKELKNKEWAQ